MEERKCQASAFQIDVSVTKWTGTVPYNPSLGSLFTDANSDPIPQAFSLQNINKIKEYVICNFLWHFLICVAGPRHYYYPVHKILQENMYTQKFSRKT